VFLPLGEHPERREQDRSKSPRRDVDRQPAHAIDLTPRRSAKLLALDRDGRWRSFSGARGSRVVSTFAGTKLASFPKPRQASRVCPTETSGTALIPVVVNAQQEEPTRRSSAPSG
jgi:hypothetical protein